MTGFQTDAETVRAHGRTLSTQLTDDLTEAVQAAETVNLGAEAMGVICQMYTFVFNDELDHAKELLGKLPEAMESTGDRLQQSAAGYEETELGATKTFGGQR